MLARRKGDYEFLYESCDITVADDFTFPFFYVHNRRRKFDVEVFLDLDLTAKAPVIGELTACEMNFLGRKDFASAFDDLHFTLSAAAFSSAG